MARPRCGRRRCVRGREVETRAVEGGARGEEGLEAGDGAHYAEEVGHAPSKRVADFELAGRLHRIGAVFFCCEEGIRAIASNPWMFLCKSQL